MFRTEYFEKKVLRYAQQLGYSAYVEWLTTQISLKKQLNFFLENLEEININDKKMCEILHQLYEKIDDIDFLECEDVQKEVEKFLVPLGNCINVKQSMLSYTCEELEYYKKIWTKSVEQGVCALEYMQRKNRCLKNVVCDVELLLILIHFFKSNSSSMHIENTAVLANIKFPTNKIYKEFVKAHSIDANYMDAVVFWKHKYPEYVLPSYLK